MFVVLQAPADRGTQSHACDVRRFREGLDRRTRISRRPGSSCAESTIRAAVWDGSAAVLGRFDGAAAIRRLLEDWIDAYEEQHFKQWDGRELGDGVVFVVAPLA
jgi:hypothetical protein